MCLVCAAVARASKENQLCATRVDGDVVILQGQSEKNSSGSDQQTTTTLMPIRKHDIVIARTTKGEVRHSSSIK